MAEEDPRQMDTEINTVPLNNSSDGGDPVSGSFPTDAMTLDNWLDGHVNSISEVVRHRDREAIRSSDRLRSLWQQFPLPFETRNLSLESNGEGEVVRQRDRSRSLWCQLPIPLETRNRVLESIHGDEQRNGEGTEERPTEFCENCNGYVEDNSLCKENDVGKNNDEESSLFDCNICFDLAKDPVVTCCGHLFCWPCLYRWIHHHSRANECPVCKGDVTLKNVTPIYGRGNEPNVDRSLKIPQRPQARCGEPDA